MTAPTQAEIREEVLEAGTEWPKDDPYVQQLRATIREWSAALRSAAFTALESPDERDGDPDGTTALWRDLRPTEAMVLRQLIDDAVGRAAERCQLIVLDELTAAGVAFAAAFPDAPRASQRVEVTS